MNRPKIGPQIGTCNRSSRSILNRNSHLRGTPLATRKDLPKGRIATQVQPAFQVSYRNGNACSDVHALNTMFAAKIVKPDSSHSKEEQFTPCAVFSTNIVLLNPRG